MAKIDFLSDTDNDILIQNGDFVIGNATATQAGVIIDAELGEIWNAPDLSVGINKYIGAKINKEALYNLIKDELERDGIKLNLLEITLENMNIYSYKIDVQ